MQMGRGLCLLLAPKDLHPSCLELSLWKGWDLANLFLAGKVTFQQDQPPSGAKISHPRLMAEHPSLSCSCGKEHTELLALDCGKLIEQRKEMEGVKRTGKTD